MPDTHAHGFQEVTCREFVELVTAWLEHALPEERTELVEEHLVMCDWCSTYLDQLQATRRALPGAVKDRAVAPETGEALRAAFRAWRERA
jgi:predicted anti-sigma-YlaC factor YlaD